jgi:hypothetical protein
MRREQCNVMLAGVVTATLALTNEVVGTTVLSCRLSRAKATEMWVTWHIDC